MRAGNKVIYTDSNGTDRIAMVDAVVGTGPSLYKRLDIAITAGERIERRRNVPHERDASGVHWREYDGSAPPAPVPEDTGEEEPELAQEEVPAAQ